MDQFAIAMPLFYPDINWYDYMLKDFSTQTQTNFNVSGGTERVKYFVSLGVFTQNGMLDTGIYDPGYSYQIAFRRYNMRSNFDINVTKNLLLSLDISNQMGNLQNPNWSTGQIMESLNSTPSNAAPGVIDNKVVTITDVFGSGRLHDLTASFGKLIDFVFDPGQYFFFQPEPSHHGFLKY